jgi:hypothetical protein
VSYFFVSISILVHVLLSVLTDPDDPTSWIILHGTKIGYVFLERLSFLPIGFFFHPTQSSHLALSPIEV